MNRENWPIAGAWLLLFLIAGCLQTVGAEQNIFFKATLLDNVCTFEQEDTPLEVKFPIRALKYFQNYSRTETESFVIGLKNCSAITLGKMVNLTFSFPQTQVVNGVAMLKPSGETGLVIALVDNKGKAIVPDHEIEVGPVTTIGTGNVNRFTLGAYVLAPESANVKAGQYSATITFTVSYR
ncbi:type 1 fimbrial protein [Salmonella enterica subsp. enterica serovar Hull]|uniref:Type 1 fimbrial protein n=1 Tax=Salmonella enterica subsp. enterica serovar Hull TaxID=1403564 RepID=A0A5X4PM60_SALET|nr:type 1 fimbrial protein [Salmonella enterica subsp. enterica serovar Putten]EBZ7588775.1 type 1 fimbrial protein [Salmonella enterica subsp. enterica serovar Hull]EBZ8651201.1 type 1 fimbrial protein [Salmonella enterica subsp. enterica serovar Hull]EEB7450873.1 fimbrial protein [Salmonella enterica subsp. enterica serovar Emek]